MDQRYYTHLAEAFVRGKLHLDEKEDGDLIELGKREGLRLHKFKRNELPRVRKVLGILSGLGFSSLLDIGSGRGTFLWPCLHRFPHAHIAAMDMAPQRVADLQAVRRGGITQLEPRQGHVEALPYADKSFDVVTVLEVLEHLRNPLAACVECLRVARNFVVASVPSKPDDNPEHIQFFTQADIQQLWQQAGARQVRVEHVLNHRVVVVSV